MIGITGKSHKLRKVHLHNINDGRKHAKFKYPLIQSFTSSCAFLLECYRNARINTMRWGCPASIPAGVARFNLTMLRAPIPSNRVPIITAVPNSLSQKSISANIYARSSIHL